MSDHVTVQYSGPVLHLELNRPEKKNALTADMYATLADALEEAEQDTTVHTVLLSAAGDAFCAGNDIADFMTAREGGLRDGPVRFIAALYRATVPIVGAVHGVAIGIGTTMLLHFDVVYAADDATFRLPFVDLALTPEAASTYLLPQVVGYQRAARLLLTAQKFDAATAADIGLVTEVVPRAELLRIAKESADLLAAKPSEAMRATKQLLKAPLRAATENALAAEYIAFEKRLASEEAQAMFAAFFKRGP